MAEWYGIELCLDCFCVLQLTTMGEHCLGRLACILGSVLFFIISLIFNGLAVVGIC